MKIFLAWRYGYNQLTMQPLDNQWKKNVDIKQRKSFFVKNVIYIDVLILKIASYQTNRNISRCYFHFPPSNLIQINFKVQQKDRFYEHLLARFFSDITLQLSKNIPYVALFVFNITSLSWKWTSNIWRICSTILNELWGISAPSQKCRFRQKSREEQILKSNFA